MGDGLLEIREGLLVLRERGVNLHDAGAVLGDLSLELSNLLNEQVLFGGEFSLSGANGGDRGLETEEFLCLGLGGLQGGFEALFHLLGVDLRLG